MHLRARHKPHIAVLVAVAVWAVFSVAYLGREDGSSGLTIIGWIHVVFFLPGVSIIKLASGSVSNGELPLAGILSWVIYSGASVGLVQLALVVRRAAHQHNAADDAAHHN